MSATIDPRSTAPRVFHLPDLGEGLTEAVIVSWLVSVGDTVRVDEPIAEVETAKSIVEVPTPYAGTVLALHGAAGDTVDTGAPLIEIGVTGAHGTGAPRSEAQIGSPSAGSGSATSGSATSGNVLIGYGTSARTGTGRRHRRAVARPAAQVGSPAPTALGSAPAALTRSAAARTGPVAVRSPIVRRLAHDLGVDVRTITPTGADGAVTRADVLAVAGELRETREMRRSGTALADPPTAAYPPQRGEMQLGELHGLQVRETTPFSPLRKMVAAKLAQSRAEIPEATVWLDVDFTELWQLRSQMAAPGQPAPSITALVARFTLMALRDYPLLAARLTGDGTEITTFDGVNLGLAADTERGLMVPVLPRADTLKLRELDTALRELSAEAGTGRLAPQRLSGSTFTLNNYGGLGVDGSAPIINHPEVAMLGIGRVIERPWVVEGDIVARRIAQLSFVFDHRVCDGGYASGFLRRVVDLIEHPLRAYGEL